MFNENSDRGAVQIVAGVLKNLGFRVPRIEDPEDSLHRDLFAYYRPGEGEGEVLVAVQAKKYSKNRRYILKCHIKDWIQSSQVPVLLFWADTDRRRVWWASPYHYLVLRGGLDTSEADKIYFRKPFLKELPRNDDPTFYSAVGELFRTVEALIKVWPYRVWRSGHPVTALSAYPIGLEDLLLVPHALAYVPTVQSLVDAVVKSVPNGSAEPVEIARNVFLAAPFIEQDPLSAAKQLADNYQIQDPEIIRHLIEATHGYKERMARAPFLTEKHRLRAFTCALEIVNWRPDRRLPLGSYRAKNTHTIAAWLRILESGILVKALINVLENSRDPREVRFALYFLGYIDDVPPYTMVGIVQRAIDRRKGLEPNLARDPILWRELRCTLTRQGDPTARSELLESMRYGYWAHLAAPLCINYYGGDSFDAEREMELKLDFCASPDRFFKQVIEQQLKSVRSASGGLGVASSC